MHFRPTALAIIFLVVLSAGSSVFGQTSSPSPVFQSWNELQLILPLVRAKDENGKTVNKITATFSGIARLGRHDVELVDGRTGVTFDFRIHKHLSLLSGVTYRRDELTNNDPHSETRLDLGGTLSTVTHQFSIRDRNMYEHRFRNGRSDTNLYRNRVQINHPLKHDGKTLFSPFISEEVYYDITHHVWTQNEFYAGIARTLSPRTVLEVSYLRSDSKPANVNGLSLTLKITLR